MFMQENKCKKPSATRPPLSPTHLGYVNIGFEHVLNDFEHDSS